MRNGELSGFLLNVGTLTALLCKEADQPFVENFLSAAKKYASESTPDSQSPQAEECAKAHEQLIGIWRGIKMSTKSQRLSPNVNVAQTARKAYEIILSCGDLFNKNYDESITLSKIMGERLQENLSKEEIELIGMSEWLSYFANAAEEFLKALTSQNQNTGGRVKGHTQSLRKAAENEFYTLVERVNAGAVYNGVEDYKQFIGAVNVCIADTKAILKGRVTRKKNNKSIVND